MVETHNRHITFEACLNFRDLGGYRGLHNRPVRWGRLYRSMTPQYMTPADAVHAQNLQLGLVIDLRGSRYETSGPLSERRRIAVGPSFLRQPVAELPPEVTALMTAPPEDALPRLLQTYGDSFAEALRAMRDHLDAPILYHCRLGKDRTGVFSALLLKLLRVSDADVIEDYMLTAAVEAEMRALLISIEGPAETQEPRVAREPVSRRAMEAVLQRLESQYGTAYNYFLRYGVSAAELNALIESLLEPTTVGSASPIPAVGTLTPLQAS